MIRDAWKELSRHRYDKVWDSFDQEFQFRPSVSAKDWPTFREPAPSITWDISDLLKGFNTWDRGTLIKTYGVDFYSAGPTKVTIVLQETKDGSWKPYVE